MRWESIIVGLAGIIQMTLNLKADKRMSIDLIAG